MVDRKKAPFSESDPHEPRQTARPGLDHGVPSLVAMDNPDDSQLDLEEQARLAPKRGSRR